MDIVSIVKTKEEDITLKDYDKNLKQDVYTITYFDNKKNKYVFQCLGGSDRFIIFLQLYEKKIDIVEKKLKGDIRPFFNKERIRRGLVSFPIGIIFAIICKSLWQVLPQNEIIYAILRCSAYFGFMVGSGLSYSFVRDIKYNEKDVQTYVPDENIVKLFKTFSKKREVVEALKRKYAKEISRFDIENSEEYVERERREIQRKFAEERQESIRKEIERDLLEMDYLEYLLLNASQKRALYEKSLKSKENRKFNPDVPSFLKRRQDKETHFLDYALHDEFNLTNTAPPTPEKDYEKIFLRGSGIDWDTDDLEEEVEKRSLKVRKNLQEKYPNTRFYDREVENSRENRGGRRR